MAHQSADFRSKTTVEVSMFLKENGIASDVCEVFEGKVAAVELQVLRAHSRSPNHKFYRTLLKAGLFCP